MKLLRGGNGSLQKLGPIIRNENGKKTMQRMMRHRVESTRRARDARIISPPRRKVKVIL